jgi:hypothetical protein
MRPLPDNVPVQFMAMQVTFRLFAGLCLFIVAGCKTRTPEITTAFNETFDRGDLGPDWLNTGAEYRLVDGRMNVKLAHNHPLWLRKRLPKNAVIEFDAMSKSPMGDLKAEVYGDGESFDPDRGRYDTTGYVLFFGGHQNTESIIGRLGEHEEAVKAHRENLRVVPGRVYHWTITRQDGTLDWKIDGQPFLSWTDPNPLSGSGHDFFAFNDWETEVTFDNLRIRSLR